ncbi:phage protein NinX family protein [Xenorhabdus sp. SGI246]|uniref:phage protein NinX family protein n=1 Tax=Xenorhabdus sp. SGI246 TaxID=3158263 RepID=UPI00349F3C77
MKIEISELKGMALNWAVAKAEGLDVHLKDYSDVGQCLCFWPDSESESVEYSPSTDWEQCGSLIEKYQIYLFNEALPEGHAWSASYPESVPTDYGDGETPQIAVCRAVVNKKLDYVIDIPDEFIQS